MARFALMAVPGRRSLAGWASIWLLYAVSFALGIAETLFDNAAQAFMPSLVHRAVLERANGRLYAGETVANAFVGPPLGGLLFAVAASLPILLDAGTFAVGAGLIAWIGAGTLVRRRPATDPAAPVEPAVPMRTRIREGLRWLWAHRLLRTLAVLLGLMNGTMMAATATFALFATDPDILGLDEVGFGLLLTAAAAGSVLASVVADRLVARIGRGPVLWSTLIGTALVPIGIGLSSDVLAVGALFALEGFVGVVWNVVTVSLRQTIVPDELLGRVNSVYRFLGWGSMPVGAFLGGLVADAFGLRAPWFVAGGGDARRPGPGQPGHLDPHDRGGTRPPRDRRPGTVSTAQGAADSEDERAICTSRPSSRTRSTRLSPGSSA